MSVEKINMSLPPRAATRLSNLVLGGLALVCGAFLASVIFHHVWRRDEQFANLTVALGSYFAPCLLMIFFAVALRARAAFKIKLASSLIVAALFLYAFEWVLFYSGPKLPHGSIDFDTLQPEHRAAVADLAKDSGVKFDIRDRLQVLMDLRSHGVDIVLPVMPRELLIPKDGFVRSILNINGREVLPLGGIADKATLFCNEAGEYVQYTSDSYGFRNPNESWNFARLQIAALGDSFAAGGCVPPGKSFVELIRDQYKATLNLAMSAHGPLLELATLKEYLPRYQPRIVLWAYDEGNDFLAIKGDQNSPLLMHYFEKHFTQNLPEVRSKINSFMLDFGEEKLGELLQKADKAQNGNKKKNIQTIINHLKLDDLRNRYGIHIWKKRELQLEGRQLDLLKRILVEAKSSVNAWGGDLYFVYLPKYGRYINDPPSPVRERELVLALVRQLDIPIIDVDQEFQAQKDPLSLFPFRKFAHYNERGQKLIAQKILRSIAPN